MDSKQIKEHIKTDHNHSTLETYIKEIIYGGNDGIVTTFAVVAGFSGANIGEHALNITILAVLLFGIANLFADGAAMGLGNFLSIRSEKKLYKNMYNNEKQLIKDSYEDELKETIALYLLNGFNQTDATTLATTISKNEDYWVRFMVQYEYGMSNPENDSAFLKGLATFLSFSGFGVVPIIPYFFMSDITKVFIVSILFTIGALISLGAIRAYTTKESYLLSIIETIIVGGTAAGLAYVIGILFKI